MSILPRKALHKKQMTMQAALEFFDCEMAEFKATSFINLEGSASEKSLVSYNPETEEEIIIYI